MGSWGTSIFANDTACDVRGMYEELLCYGHTPEDAEQQVLQELEMDIDDPENDPDAWLALAATEWRCGRKLSEDVRKVALTLIDQPASSELWETEKQKVNRRKALDRLREQLNAPLPRPKRLKPLPVIHSPWNVGDVVALRLPENDKYPALSGKYALILITEIRTCKVSRYAPADRTEDIPYFSTYYWWGDDLSQCSEIIAQASFAALRERSVDTDVCASSQMLFQPFRLHHDEMDLYAKHPVVGHVNMADIASVRSQYQYDCSYGLSQTATLLHIQYWLTHAEPVSLSIGQEVQ